jgi:hypothetical protein
MFAEIAMWQANVTRHSSQTCDDVNTKVPPGQPNAVEM